MRTIVKVKRGACCVFNNSLNRELAAINGVYGVNVDNYKNEITIDHTSDLDYDQFVLTLTENGYEVLPGQEPQKTDYSNFEWPLEQDNN